VSAPASALAPELAQLTAAAMHCPRCMLQGRTVPMQVGHECASADERDTCEFCAQRRYVLVTCVDERGSFSELQPCGCLPSAQARIARERGAR